MSKPNKTLEWIPTDDPSLIIQPDLAKQNAGFSPGEKVISQHLNYVWNAFSKWTNWLYTSKFDIDNTLESFLAGVSFADIGNVSKSTIVGYQAVDGLFNDVIVVGYNAISNATTIAAGSTVIGVNLIDGVNYLNPTFAIGYNGYVALSIDYTTKKASADFSFVFADGQGVDSALKLIDSMYLLANGSSDILPAEISTLLDSGGWRFWHSFSGTNYTFTLDFYNATAFQIFNAPIQGLSDGVYSFTHKTSTKTELIWGYDSTDDYSYLRVGSKGLIRYLFASDELRMVHQDFASDPLNLGFICLSNGNSVIQSFDRCFVGVNNVKTIDSTYSALNGWNTKITKRLSMEADSQLNMYPHAELSTIIVNGAIPYKSPSIFIDFSGNPSSLFDLIYITDWPIYQGMKIGDRFTILFKKTAAQEIRVGRSANQSKPTGFIDGQDALILANGANASYPFPYDRDCIAINGNNTFGAIELIFSANTFVPSWGGTARVFTTFFTEFN